MAFKRFVEVPAERLLALMEEIGQKIHGDGGRYERRREGREVVYDLVPAGGRAMVTVYTSLAEGAEVARACGEDAIRVLLTVRLPEGLRQLDDPKKILRTAPLREPDPVSTFLERLRGELRESFWHAKKVPTCRACGSPMAVRAPEKKPTEKFYGCITFPKCKATQRYVPPPPVPSGPPAAR
jgi:hypothetical protein